MIWFRLSPVTRPVFILSSLVWSKNQREPRDVLVSPSLANGDLNRDVSNSNDFPKINNKLVDQVGLTHLVLTQKFPPKILPPDTHTYVCTLEGKKC